MRIWWCQEHEAESAYRLDDPKVCWRSLSPKVCRMVPMRLIPDNEETVERIAKAMWVAPLHGEPEGVYIHRMAKAVLAALDGETP